MDRKELNKLIEGVKNFSLSESDLEIFYSNLLHTVPIIQNRFRKHYNKNIIYSAIEQLQKGLMNEYYFSLWCDVYFEIIQHYNKPKNVSNFECYVVQYNICELLFMLSYWTPTEHKRLKKIKQMLELYDELYHNIENLKIIQKSIITITNDNNSITLAINDKQKTCYLLCNLQDDEIAQESKAKIERLRDKAKKLEEKGYVLKTDQMLVELRYKGLKR